MTTVAKDHQVRRGFAGLADLVSEVDSVIRVTARQRVPEPDPVSHSPSPRQTAATQARPATEYGTADPNESSRPNRGGLKVVFGLLAAGAAILVFVTVGQEPSRPSSAVRPPSVVPTPTTRAPTVAPTPTTRAPTIPTTQTAARPTEQAPLITTPSSPILNVAQIRYCLAQDIRLETARPTLQNNDQIARFNRAISDWNSRCGSYQYDTADMKSAQGYVSRYMIQIQAEGRALFP